MNGFNSITASCSRRAIRYKTAPVACDEHFVQHCAPVGLLPKLWGVRLDAKAVGGIQSADKHVAKPRFAFVIGQHDSPH